MEIYFEGFGEGYHVSFLTPGKLYDVVEFSDGGVGAYIRDDDGDQIWVKMAASNLIGSSWKMLSEKTKAPSAVDIVASLESERNALANSIDSVNELLDSLDVPKAETLRERVSSALADGRMVTSNAGARIVQRSGDIDCGSHPLNPVRVRLKTESGEVIYFRAELDN